MSTVAEILDPRDDLDIVVEEAREALVDLQRDDGHWVFEFEPDATICPDRTRPLVFYELDWCVTTFRVDKESPCTLRFSWSP